MDILEREEIDSPLKIKEHNDGDSTAWKEMDKIGKYQMISYLLIGFPIALSAAFTLGYAFTSGEVKYRCFVPECENLTTAEWKNSWTNFSAPQRASVFGSCQRYEVKTDAAGECSLSSFSDKVVSCDTWVYDPEEKTILNEWNFTCDGNRWKLTLVGTITNVGQLIGLIFTGYLSDKYGRRTCLVTGTVLSGMFGLIQSFSVNYWMFLILEFLQALSAAGMYSSGYILGMEMVAGSNRVVGGTFISCMYSVGENILGLVAMSLKSWRPILRAIFIPGLFVIFLPFFLPESIRWLAVRGKHDEIDKIYRKIAKMNGLKISTKTISIYRELNERNFKRETEEGSNAANVPVREALSRPRILIRLLVCCLCWLIAIFVYYGLSLNSVSFSGDKYVNFILVTLIEIPAYCLSWLLMNRIGRKITLSGSFLLSGIFCLAIQFVPDTWEWTPLILYMAGKACVTMAFGTIYLFTTEMFPTTVRHFLLSICSMTGRIGSMLAPQTRLLATIVESLPLILFGSMGIIAGLLSIILPETLGLQLPDTVTEAENLGRSNKLRDNYSSS